MSAKMTSTTRFVVRTALVTSTTLATIIGAQALASVDKAASSQSAVEMSIPSGQITSAAPNIVILRRAGDRSDGNSEGVILQPLRQTDGPSTTRIAPPSPVQVAPSQSILQQLLPFTRSSR